MMKRVTYLILTSMLALFLAGCSPSAVNSVDETSPGLVVPKVSVQLWSVKDQVKADIDKTLAQLAQMGFAGVEFANEFGPYADNPAALKAKMDSLGLSGSGAHVGFERLNDEHFDATVTFYTILGVDTLIIPWDERAWSSSDVTILVEELNVLSDKLAKHDMKIGYHNHAEEFNDYKDATYWDFIAQNTHNNVVMQQDVGWTTFAGKDPAEYVRRYPGRTFTTHYKVRLPEGTQGKLPLIGQDTIDWVAVLKANIEVGGTKWIVVEQEEYPNELTPLEAVQTSLNGLNQAIKQLD